ncbi:MAG TPA: glutamine--tRNA ligase/YqeY domain fusion protein [Pseudomonadales bacterium]
MSTPDHTPSNFIRQIIDADLAAGKHTRIVTRFPPEPNGYLHIGHAKSICLNFGLARDYQGDCNLRFDDTNPEKEDMDYVESIQRDVSWLGFEWAGDVRYASGYFQQIHDFAVELIEAGKAYVDSLNADQIREYRGTLTEPGRASPYRDRPVAENIDLFARMKAGEFAEGEHVLRAKIDMAAPNINLRDPILYRVRHQHHHQTGDAWCIYPMYDFTHPISDAIEGITHSLCTLEFEDHRPLYDWVLDNISIACHPQQTEFARLNLSYTLTSKRKLKQLVDEQRVEGWNDPRMPTIAGFRRRGYTAQSIRHFCERIGVSRADSMVDVAMLEHAIREDLDESAPRAMCVLRPLKVTIENWPADKTETLTLPAHPKREELGVREVSFTRELFIDQEDFSEDPPKGWKRLAPNGHVRLRGGYVMQCTGVEKDAAGKVVALSARYDENTLGKNPEGYKPAGVIHWVSATHSVPCEVRLYDRLFTVENPDGDKTRDFIEFLNPDSLHTQRDARVEPSVAKYPAESRFQFEREGYFAIDPASTNDQLIINRTVTLRDSWGKEQARGQGK